MGDPRLENYLSTLDRALGGLSVSDRADIVTELKSHVLSAMERDSSQSVDTVLAAMGEPEMVANRYLLERGLKPGKPPISPIVKWVVIGFLGTLAVFLGALVVLAIYLSPILKVDSEKNQVKLFGGLVEVDGDDIQIGNRKLGRMNGYKFSGRSQAPGVKSTAISLSNGKIKVYTAKDGHVAWDCKASTTSSEHVNPGPKGEIIDLTAFEFVKCEIGLPEGSSASIAGANGKIEIEEPKFSVSAELANGAVDLEPGKGTRYEYDLHVNNGRVASFTSDPDPEYKIRVALINGTISN